MVQSAAAGDIDGDEVSATALLYAPHAAPHPAPVFAGASPAASAAPKAYWNPVPHASEPQDSSLVRSAGPTVPAKNSLAPELMSLQHWSSTVKPAMVSAPDMMVQSAAGAEVSSGVGSGVSPPPSPPSSSPNPTLFTRHVISPSQVTVFPRKSAPSLPSALWQRVLSQHSFFWPCSSAIQQSSTSHPNFPQMSPPFL